MKTHLIAGLLTCMASLAAYAECGPMPTGPTIPSGATAGREEMVATQKAVKAFDATANEYVACLQKSGGSASQQKQDMVLDTLQRVADKFNTELRNFKKKEG